MTNPKFGSDPEVFAFYDQWEERYAMSPISLEDEYNLTPIFDDIKHPVYYQNKDGVVIMDGVAFEFNLKRPFSTSADMFTALKKLQKEFNEYLLLKVGWETIAQPCINFDVDKWWNNSIDSNERSLQGFIFGCDRSYNIYSDRPAPFISAREHPFRYGAGHIHISHPILTDNPLQSIRAMDMLFGTYYMSKAVDKKGELLRSKIYGKPGSFRPKGFSYNGEDASEQYSDGSTGIEYRTPSNNWLNLSVEEFSVLDQLTDKLLCLLSSKDKLVKAFNAFLEPANESILTANFKLAEQVYNNVLEV